MINTVIDCPALAQSHVELMCTGAMGMYRSRRRALGWGLIGKYLGMEKHLSLCTLRAQERGHRSIRTSEREHRGVGWVFEHAGTWSMSVGHGT